MVATTTRWKDDVENDFEKILKKLIDEIPADDTPGNTVWHDWSIIKIFDESLQKEFDGHNVEFNFIKYSYSQTTKNEISSDSHTIQKDGFIIPYKINGKIYYIINQNTSAKKLLRKLLTYTNKNELLDDSFGFTNDFFMWLLYRVYSEKYNIEMVPKGKCLSVDSIKGFKGDTEDYLTQVSASGESVMNIISTLSFILESSRLNQIKININYTDHNISLRIQKGNIYIYFDEYQGSCEEDDMELKTSELYLIVYLEIIPYLMQEYDSDKVNEAWSRDVKIKFMKDVADILQIKVQNRIADLGNEEYI